MEDFVRDQENLNIYESILLSRSYYVASVMILESGDLSL